MERAYDTITVPGRRDKTRKLFARERLLLAIYDHTEHGPWQETCQTIADAIGLGEKSVHRASAELRALGLITVSDEFGDDGGRLPNRWSLTDSGRTVADRLATLVDACSV